MRPGGRGPGSALSDPLAGRERGGRSAFSRCRREWPAFAQRGGGVLAEPLCVRADIRSRPFPGILPRPIRVPILSNPTSRTKPPVRRRRQRPYDRNADARRSPPPGAGRPEGEIAAATHTLVSAPTSRAAHRGPGTGRPRPPAPSRPASTRRPGSPPRSNSTCVESLAVSLPRIRPSTYLGKGKVEEIAGLIEADEIALVVMDCALSPVQQRNLEKAWGAKVIDRTGLILEIFGRRARTREGTLQVELAHLNYQKSRLVRSWTHLERQRGGFGFLGGPGETQIESDRRLIQERMARIERDLDQVKRTRALHRQAARKVPYPIVALVGYTNAGKSTLFNRLTRAEVTGRGYALRHARPNLARAQAAAWRQSHPVRHGGLHLRPADYAGRRLPRHTGRGAGGGRHPARARHLAWRYRSAGRRCASSSQALAWRKQRRSLIEVWNKADLLDGRPSASPDAAASPQRARPRPAASRPSRGRDRRPARHDRAPPRFPPTRPPLNVDLPTRATAAALNWLYETPRSSPAVRRRRHPPPRRPHRPREGAALPQPLRGGPAPRPGGLMAAGGVGNPPLPGLRAGSPVLRRRTDTASDDAAVLRAMQAGGGLRLLALRVVIVLVLLMAAQAYDGSLHALSHWFILGLYGLGTVWFGLRERGGGPMRHAYGWAGTGLNAGLAVYVIIEHMMAGGGAGLGADAVSRLPAFLLLLQTGLSMRVAQTLVFCGLVTLCWSAAFLVGVLHPELFPSPDTFPTAQVTGLATFVAAGLLVVDGTARLRAAVTRALRMEHERTQLARFVPDTVALDLAAEDGEFGLGIHRRHACLLMLDIRGFSRMSREHPPEAMVTALLAVRAAAQAAVAEQGGLVDKYIGDAVLVQFVVGRPDAQARAALACALSIRDRIAALNAARAREGLFALRGRGRPARGRPPGRCLRRRGAGRVHGAGSGDERPGADRDPGQGGRDRARRLGGFPGSARRRAPGRDPVGPGSGGRPAGAPHPVGAHGGSRRLTRPPPAYRDGGSPRCRMPHRDASLSPEPERFWSVRSARRRVAERYPPHEQDHPRRTLALGLVLGTAAPVSAAPGDGLSRNSAATGNSNFGGMHRTARMQSRMARHRMMHRHHHRHMMRRHAR